MPRYSVIAVRLALAHLVVGSAFGAIVLAAGGLPGWSLPPALLAFGRLAHPAALQFGWMLQLVFGVAFWILPRFLEGPPRGREWPAWIALVAVNAGVAAAYAGYLTLSHGLVAAGAAAFAVHAIPRIRAIRFGAA